MKGVTINREFPFIVIRYFNPHTREGCDHFPYIGGHSKSDFNPHTREGCDDEPDQPEIGIEGISIHTPVKGVTGEAGDQDIWLPISIHTPVKGVTEH